MEMHFFTVFDSAAGAFLEPFVAPSVEVAIRSFRQAVNQEKHQFNLFPSDYTLFHIGSFSQQTGYIEAAEPRSLGVALTYLNREVV